MKRTTLITTVATFLLGYGAIVAAGSDMWLPSHQMKDHSMARHIMAQNNGYPARYADLLNPLPDSQELLQEGGELFKQHCASCHGERGLGDGPAGAGLSPTPANLMLHSKRSFVSDGYLFWTISDGGKQFETGMPAFETVLAPEERWKVIRYMKQLSF